MLTQKQELFCIEYAKCGNGRQAYINAGYKCKNENAYDAAASRLLRDVKVKERLAELTEEIKAESIADMQEMQEILTGIIRQSVDEEVIVTNSNKGTYKKTKKKPAIKDVISAINTLGKMQGLFSEKVELDIAIPVFEGEDDLEE